MRSTIPNRVTKLHPRNFIYHFKASRESTHFPKPMLLDQGTCISLALGAVALCLVYRTLALRVIEGVHRTFATPSTQLMALPNAVAPEIAPLVTPAAQSAPALSAPDDGERIRAQLEAQHRDEWCQNYEEREVGRYFRERFYHHEQSRLYGEDRRLEAAHNRLEHLMDRRQTLQESMDLDHFVQCAGFSGLPA
jgi:hypothetical protein